MSNVQIKIFQRIIIIYYALSFAKYDNVIKIKITRKIVLQNKNIQSIRRWMKKTYLSCFGVTKTVVADTKKILVFSLLVYVGKKCNVGTTLKN